MFGLHASDTLLKGNGYQSSYLIPSLLPQAYIRLKIDADLRSVFTWNTKQVFAYAKTQFETDRNQRNEMVVWSSIVTDKVGVGLWCVHCLLSLCTDI